MNHFHIHTLSLRRCRGGMLGTAARIMLALIVGAAAVACGGDDVLTAASDEPHMPDEEGVVYLTLDVEISENLGDAAVSRADNDYYFQRPLLQNEKLNDLRVIIVRTDNNTIEHNRQVKYDERGQIINNNNLTFKVVPGKKRICLVGNLNGLPEDLRRRLNQLAEGTEMTADILDDVTLTRLPMTPSFAADRDIPMTETFDDIDVEAIKPADSNIPTYLYKTLFVTRVATKYTIETPEDYSSLKIRLYGIATEQYLMPHDTEYKPQKGLPAQIISGISGRAITKFSTPADAPVEDFEIELTGKTPVNDAEGNFLYYRYNSFYLMETAGTEFKINALIDGDLGKIDGVDYSGTWFPDNQIFPNLPSLPRNTHVIVRMSAKYGLHCVVDVVPYRGCTLEPYFGLE